MIVKFPAVKSQMLYSSCFGKQYWHKTGSRRRPNFNQNFKDLHIWPHTGPELELVCDQNVRNDTIWGLCLEGHIALCLEEHFSKYDWQHILKKLSYFQFNPKRCGLLGGVFLEKWSLSYQIFFQMKAEMFSWKLRCSANFWHLNQCF